MKRAEFGLGDIIYLLTLAERTGNFRIVEPRGPEDMRRQIHLLSLL